MSILYLIDRPHPWVLYTPALVRLARQTGGRVELLSVVGAMGTGTFSSNFPGDDDHPALKPRDTRAYEKHNDEALREMSALLERAGVQAATTWLPDLDGQGFEQFLQAHQVQIFAHARPGWFERLWRNAAIERLERGGVRVELLAPYSDPYPGLHRGGIPA